MSFEDLFDILYSFPNNVPGTVYEITKNIKGIYLLIYACDCGSDSIIYAFENPIKVKQI